MQRQPATLARGVALVAILATYQATAVALWNAWPTPPAAQMPACRTPVEVRVPDGTAYLDCAEAPTLPATLACKALPAGAGVDVRDGTCTAHLGGMRAGWRLLVGLPLDVNRATATDLQHIPGLGAKTAARIVAFRAAHGPFQNIEALMAMPGVGRKTLAKWSPHLEVPPPAKS